MLKQRRVRALRMADLKKLRVAWNRAKFFVQTPDHVPRSHELESLLLRERLTAAAPRQLSLFDAADSARSGEV
ncbi:MAG: hypothetical protein QM775_04050 [Pirellulales bacterium]